MNRKTIAIWAPSLSPGFGTRALYDRATKRLENTGYTVLWSPAASQAFEAGRKDRFDSMSLDDKLADLRWAFEATPDVLICAIGGYNGYQVLERIDWDALKASALVPVGHSDFTAIGNAYFAMTGKLAWYGINLRNMGDIETGDVSVENFIRTFRQPCIGWRPLSLYKNSFQSRTKKGAGWFVVRPGSARGKGVGGNIGTFFLLQGTPYMPQFTESTILFLEEDEMPGRYAVREFDRKLRSILDQPGARQTIKGLIIGRFLDETQTTRSMIREVIDAIPFFDDKPVIANVEIGHGMPRLLLPIGGEIELATEPKRIVVYNPSAEGVL